MRPALRIDMSSTVLDLRIRTGSTQSYIRAEIEIRKQRHFCHTNLSVVQGFDKAVIVLENKTCFGQCGIGTCGIKDT